MPFDYDFRFGGYPVVLHNLSIGAVEDLTLNVYAPSVGEGIRIDFDGSSAVFDDVAIHNHAQRFVRLVEQAASQPHRRLGGLDLLLPYERSRLSAGWDVNLPSVPLPSLFELAIERSPSPLR